MSADHKRAAAILDIWEENLRLKSDNAAQRAALQFIADHGGKHYETECGTIACNGSWCAEQARAAMGGAK